MMMVPSSGSTLPGHRWAPGSGLKYPALRSVTCAGGGGGGGIELVELDAAADPASKVVDPRPKLGGGRFNRPPGAGGTTEVIALDEDDETECVPDLLSPLDSGPFEPVVDLLLISCSRFNGDCCNVAKKKIKNWCFCCSCSCMMVDGSCSWLSKTCKSLTSDRPGLYIQYE